MKTFGIIGWIVVHSLWQWTLIGGAAALLLGSLRHARAQTRYAIGVAAVLVMIAVTVATSFAATMMFEPAVRYRALYAFGGALLMPDLFARGSTLLRGVGMVWLTGVLVGAAVLIREVRRVRRLARSDRYDLDQESRAIAEALRSDMRIRQRVSVGHSTLATVPMVLGALRPQVLLPAAARLLTPDQRRSILVHEFGHVRRRDVIANLVQVVFDLVTFYHPAARWLSWQLRLEREYACDELVVRFTKDAHSYARALATLEDARSHCRLVVAAASGTLLDRIERIVGRARPSLTPLRGALACIVALVLAAGLLALALNMPAPWLPDGIRLRTPMPQANRGL